MAPKGRPSWQDRDVEKGAFDELEGIIKTAGKSKARLHKTFKDSSAFFELHPSKFSCTQLDNTKEILVEMLQEYADMLEIILGRNDVKADDEMTEK
jgi:hypothetical protein